MLNLHKGANEMNGKNQMIIIISTIIVVELIGSANYA